MKTHACEIPEEFYEISDPDLISAFADASLYSTALGRARLAAELVTYLNGKRRAQLGTPYGAWREDEKVYLSTLPSLHAAQETLEFHLNKESKSLDLAGVWIAKDGRYGAIHYSSWQPAIKGLTADRADLDLDREVVIKILEDRGTEFGFPIVPVGSVPEKLCGWITQEPPSDYMNWSRDPRLVPEGIAMWQFGYHRPSNVGVLQFCLHGRWSSAAFEAYAGALRVLLPGRYSNHTAGQGSIRVTVFLCAESLDNEPSLWRSTVHRIYAVIARMVAARRGLPLPPPRDDDALPSPSEVTRKRFQWAAGEQGDGEYTKLADQSDMGFDDAVWIKLRHRFFGFTEMPHFSFGSVVTPSELVKFVENNEKFLEL